MNNHNNQFGLTNSAGYSHNGNYFENSHGSMINPSPIRSDMNLIRPIPKKVDLSKMIYQQFVDPYPRQNQSSILELSETMSQNIFSEMCQNAMSSNNAQNTIGNRFNEFSRRLQNPHFPFNNSRLSYNQLLMANNNRNNSEFFKNHIYPNSINLPPSPVLGTNMDPYLYSNINYQVPIRHNQVSSTMYMSRKDSEEKSPNKELYNEMKSNNKVQYFPKTSLSDDLIENHFSMSLNSHMKFDFKSNESLLITSKQERISRKPLKQQYKPEIDKSCKAIKRAKKSKATPDNFDRSQDMSHTLCATPSDSSISPNSMVSCRSTITPQAVYQNNFNTATLLVNSQNSNNHLSVINIKTSDPSSSFQKTSQFSTSLINDGNSRSLSLHESQFQGLPLKKRIKWQIENDDTDVEVLEDNEIKKTNDGKSDEIRQTTQSTDSEKSGQTVQNDSPLGISEYPLKTFQKTFLPMEKHSSSSDSDSDNEESTDAAVTSAAAATSAAVTNGKYSFSLKDQNGLLFVDNNI